MFLYYRIAHEPVDEEYIITDMFLDMNIWYIVGESLETGLYEIIEANLTLREAEQHLNQIFKDN